MSLLALLSLSSHAGYSQWSEEDKKLFIASNVAIVFNWATTRDMSRRYNEGFHETSVFLRAIGGEQPKTSTVDLYFIARLTANYLLTDYLTEYKKPYLIMTTITHTSGGIHNIGIGLKVNF